MHTDWLRDQTNALADAVSGLEPGKRVPTCPEWSVRDLVAHVGLIQRRATLIVQTGEAVPFPSGGEAPDDWGPWLREGADELARAADEAGEKEVWSFVGDKRPASFWLRRMLHDTTIHAVDGALTAETSYDIPAGLAVDGIDEGLSLVRLMQGVIPGLAELRGDGETLLLSSTQGDGWLITRNPDGPHWKRTVTDAADVTVTGTVQQLLLVFYRRLSLDDVVVSGERELITHWLAHTAL
ncbi:maleylpyruvate isomerase family mycothiol-dependent enzyme [Kibdelosporangium aridum]|uniref:Maleylpyruvate isomerase family mycothiol-dependent enzyme n=1 Tax=Kibdelosporangium aridum TaxID=2030 RepID=A0A428ZNW5_KIBAR|nr:maleylpyruvate isomerase family mycothiol-dependent enzyme [Kibdelosporangium aridum]RSM89744.1 maleylpyruvate isomerase family mycothiol-dependent enzyme [Kibdelosporangium aridum]